MKLVTIGTGSGIALHSNGDKGSKTFTDLEAISSSAARARADTEAQAEAMERAANMGAPSALPTGRGGHADYAAAYLASRLDQPRKSGTRKGSGQSSSSRKGSRDGLFSRKGSADLAATGLFGRKGSKPDIEGPDGGPSSALDAIFGRKGSADANAPAARRPSAIMRASVEAQRLQERPNQGNLASRRGAPGAAPEQEIRRGSGQIASMWL